MSTDRLYGNWLPAAQRFALRGIGWKGVSLAVGAYFAAVLLAQYSLRVGVALVLTASVGILLAGVRIGGTSVAGHGVAVLQWRTAQRGGAVRHTAVTSHGWALHGPLAQTRMVDVHAGGGPYGAVHDPSSPPARSHAAARLHGGRPQRRCRDTTPPSPGGNAGSKASAGTPRSLQRSPSSRRHRPPAPNSRPPCPAASAPEAPPDCAALMATLVAAQPGGRRTYRHPPHARLRPAQPGTPRSAAIAARQGIDAYLPLLDRSVTGLESALDGCGVTVLGRATAGPARGRRPGRVRPRGRRRGRAGASTDATGRGPGVGAAPGLRRRSSTRDAYAHDTGTSASFVWAPAPRQLVAVDRARRAHPARAAPQARHLHLRADPRRSTRWTLQPPSQRGQRLAADGLADCPSSAGPGPRRTSGTPRAAEQATREVAAGAGWIAQTVSVTVTVLDEADLPAAIAELEHAAGGSQLRLRRLHRTQAAGFLAGLPAGLSLHRAHPAVVPMIRWSPLTRAAGRRPGALGLRGDDDADGRAVPVRRRLRGARDRRPVGRHLGTHEVVCCDPFAWHEAGLTPTSA